MFIQWLHKGLAYNIRRSLVCQIEAIESTDLILRRNKAILLLKRINSGIFGCSFNLLDKKTNETNIQ